MNKIPTIRIAIFFLDQVLLGFPWSSVSLIFKNSLVAFCYLRKLPKSWDTKNKFGKNDKHRVIFTYRNDLLGSENSFAINHYVISIDLELSSE